MLRLPGFEPNPETWVSDAAAAGVTGPASVAATRTRNVAAEAISLAMNGTLRSPSTIDNVHRPHVRDGSRGARGRPDPGRHRPRARVADEHAVVVGVRNLHRRQPVRVERGGGEPVRVVEALRLVGQAAAGPQQHGGGPAGAGPPPGAPGAGRRPAAPARR